MGRMKRKNFSEVEVDSFVSDGLALPKRVRLDPDLPIFCGDQQGVEMQGGFPVETSELPQPVLIPELQQTTEPLLMATEPMSAVPNDEKALVLYKPVNPPVFPGGPAAGSPDLPIKCNTNSLWNQKAWQIQANLPDLFRFARPSDSGAISVSRRTLDIKPVDNRLAVVPWVPSQFQRSTDQLTFNQKNCDDSTENEEPMAMEDEDMVSMEEDPVQPQQPLTPSTSLASEMVTDGMQWQQHCLTPQTPINQPVMWSY